MNKFAELMEIVWMVLMLSCVTILAGLNLWMYLQ